MYGENQRLKRKLAEVTEQLKRAKTERQDRALIEDLRTELEEKEQEIITLKKEFKKEKERLKAGLEAITKSIFK